MTNHNTDTTVFVPLDLPDGAGEAVSINVADGLATVITTKLGNDGTVSIKDMKQTPTDLPDGEYVTRMKGIILTNPVKVAPEPVGVAAGRRMDERQDKGTKSLSISGLRS